MKVVPDRSSPSLICCSPNFSSKKFLVTCFATDMRYNSPVFIRNGCIVAIICNQQ